MITMHLYTNEGDCFSTEMPSVPRVGEQVKLVRSVLTVVKVVYVVKDRYTNFSIQVFLE